jgi:hypothetical protein
VREFVKNLPGKHVKKLSIFPAIENLADLYIDKKVVGKVVMKTAYT